MYDWVSIPELGNRLQLDTNEGAELLMLLGLRWKEKGVTHFRDDIFWHGIARKITPTHGYKVVQWNVLAIRAMVNENNPAECWNAHVERMEYEETARALMRQLNTMSGADVIRQLRTR